jgi:hypothetical protein
MKEKTLLLAKFQRRIGLVLPLSTKSESQNSLRSGRSRTNTLSHINDFVATSRLQWQSPMHPARSLESRIKKERFFSTHHCSLHHCSDSEGLCPKGRFAFSLAQLR